MSRTPRLIVFATLSLLLSIAGGSLMHQLAPEGLPITDPQIAYASHCGVPSTCLGGSTRGLASITVRHDMAASSTDAIVRVDNAAETFDVTAHWLTTDNDPCPCDEATATVSVNVNWDAVNNNWTAACAGCNAAAGPIYSVGICPVSNCGGQASKPYSYRLIVQMDRTRAVSCTPNPSTGFLNRVEFATTALSNGLLYSGLDCVVTMTVVTPVYTSYSTNDPGDWECDTNCANARGPELAITYE